MWEWKEEYGGYITSQARLTRTRTLTQTRAANPRCSGLTLARAPNPNPDPEQVRRLGASCDWSRERFTLEPDMCEAVNEAFVRLHEKVRVRVIRVRVRVKG